MCDGLPVGEEDQSGAKPCTKVLSYDVVEEGGEGKLAHTGQAQADSRVEVSS